MSRITYLLSEQFAYEKTIHADAGPDYARRHGWPSASLGQLSAELPDGPVLIDNRVTEEEMAALSRLLPRLAGRPVYLKVIDPYWECIRQPYYRWLLTLTRLPHICFVGPYPLTGMTGLLRELSRPDAYLHLPYAYEAERELPLAQPSRTRLLAVSGAARADIYPERAAVLRAVRRHWWSARQVSVLPHPGYPDVGQSARHTITGTTFLQYLSQHRFMYLEPSCENLEFLKYTECAYAGCVPVGRAPATFPEELRRMVRPLESSRLVADLRALKAINPAECRKSAQAYRETLRRLRDPLAVTAELINHWKSQTIRLAALR